MTASIEELRNRAWNVANNITSYNAKFIEVLYRGMNNKPKIITLPPEDTRDYSIQYIRDLIQTANENFKSLNSSTNMLNYISVKHNECKVKYEQLKG